MLFHLATRHDWDRRTADHYAPADWQAEGFVHCSSATQLVGTANAIFSGRTDLVLLTLDQPG